MPRHTPEMLLIVTQADENVKTLSDGALSYGVKLLNVEETVLAVIDVVDKRTMDLLIDAIDRAMIC